MHLSTFRTILGACLIALFSLGCGEDGTDPNPAPTTGAIQVTTVTTGQDTDPDGYLVTIDGGSGRAIGINASIHVVGLSAGNHTVVLGDLEANCAAASTTTSVTVVAGDTASVSFTVACSALNPAGSINVTTTTTGTNLDADGYSVSIDGGAAQAIGVNGSLDFTSIVVGSHTVELSGAALNCSVAGGFAQTVDVTNGGSAAADFVLSCGSAPTGTIVFSTDRDGQMEVYSIKPDGTGATRLTTAGQIDWYPSLSEDGTKIVFESNRDGNFEIYSMNVDGSGELNLTNDPGVDWYPTWSPDGSQIVFSSTRNGGHLEIYIMNADGSGITQLTSGTDESLEPQWSPDGTTILFTRRTPAGGGNPAGPSKLWTMNIDGTGQAPLLPGSTSSDEGPEYSPDGLQIVFISNRDGNAEVYLVNSDGTGINRLTNTPSAREQVPSFEPLGRYIVFDTDRDQNIELYTMNVDGSNPTRFTNNPAQDFAADWKQ